MALFSFLVSKFGVPAVAFFAGCFMLLGYSFFKFILFFLENPETVLNATKPIWSKLIEAVK